MFVKDKNKPQETIQSGIVREKISRYNEVNKITCAPFSR